MESKPKTKVLHLVTRMNVGGVAVLIDNLLSNLNSNDFEVLLATGVCEEPEAEFLTADSQNYKIQSLPKFHKTSRLTDDIVSFLTIVKLIRSFKPDIIHTHTSKAGVYGRLAGLVFSPRTKRVHTYHGHLLVGYFSKPKLFIVVTIEKILAFMSTALIAMGTQVRDDLLSVKIGSLRKFKVFFPGVVSPKFPSRIDARNALGLDQEATYCIYIGRLTQIKRPERILEISSITKSQNLNLRYLIVGDGDLYAELSNSSEARSLPISFLGWRKDIPQLLAACDFLLLTSDNEAVALTLIEASQAGIPFVTTDAGSVRDIAINRITGIVTNFEINNLAIAVTELAKSPELRTSMGKEGQKIAAEKFSIHRMVVDHQEFYKGILSL